MGSAVPFFKYPVDEGRGDEHVPEEGHREVFHGRPNPDGRQSE